MSVELIYKNKYNLWTGISNLTLIDDDKTKETLSVRGIKVKNDRYTVMTHTHDISSHHTTGFLVWDCDVRSDVICITFAFCTDRIRIRSEFHKNLALTQIS